MTVYRLEAERAGAGPHLFPRPFGSVEEAAAFGERNLDRLAAHFGWRVRAFRVLELPSMRIVTTVRWFDPVYDPDPFDPFAPPVLPAAGGSGPGEGERPTHLPAAEAPSPHPEHRLTTKPRWRSS